MTGILSSFVGRTPAGAASNTWTTYSLLDLDTSSSQYGFTKNSIGIHGIQNTNNLVLVLGTQNSARTTMYITPVVINLSTGAMAKGSRTTLTATPNGNYTSVALGNHWGGKSYGVAALGHYTGSIYTNRYYGYYFTNWGSISPTTVPTLSLSSALTDTVSMYLDLGLSYGGGNIWIGNFRNASSGDYSGFRSLTYSGSSSAPAFANTYISASTNRRQGFGHGFLTGLTTNYWNSVSPQPGNNNNIFSVQYAQGQTGSSTARAASSKDNLVASGSRNYFDGDTIRDTTGPSWFMISSVNDSPTNTWSYAAGEWTNANSTSAPSVTWGSVQTSVGGAGWVCMGNRLTTAYRCRWSGGNAQYTPITLNTSTRALTLGTELTATGSAANGNNYFQGFYDSTYGQWIFNMFWDGANIDFYASKYNP